jgi:HSP20 family molecular chaperone IbpA
VAQRFQPALAPDEREILHEQGAYTLGRTWKLGEFCLTDRRLLFGHMHRQFLEIDLGRVEDMCLRKKAFMLTRKPCVVLTYRNGGGGKPREAWIVNGHVEKWRSAIAGLLAERGLELREELPDAGEDLISRCPEDPGERLYAREDPRAAGPAVRMGRRDVAQASKEHLQAVVKDVRSRDSVGALQARDLAEVARLVDRGSAKMLWHFWKNRHYRLDELKQMLGETSHMGVLARIRDVINPAATRLLGKPVLVFERSRVDQQTGKHVLHSWWLNEEPAIDTTGDSQFVDLFDEGDHFLVILELAGANEEDIQVEARDGRLSVAVDTAERRYYEETPLPAGADARDLSTTYRNGILQVRLGKEAA